MLGGDLQLSTIKKTADESSLTMEASFETRAARSFATNYQVGEPDETGFVNIGIEVRPFPPRDMNNTFFGNGGPGQFISYEDDTSSSGYTSDASVGRAKRYQ